MSDELYVFLGAAVVSVLAGLYIRVIALEHEEALRLSVLDFTKDLFTAAAAVFPTTLAIEMPPGQKISFSGTEFGGMIVLVAAIGLWAKGDTRYFAYWRRGQIRTKENDGTLGDPVVAPRPRMWQAMAFMIGNGLGLAVLYFSTTLSNQVAT